jgi:hypothetical protein
MGLLKKRGTQDATAQVIDGLPTIGVKVVAQPDQATCSPSFMHATVAFGKPDSFTILVW